ncbi:MAG: TetR/AcrR family transcriptional regulator [Marmoricola sp.]
MAQDEVTRPWRSAFPAGTLASGTPGRARLLEVSVELFAARGYNGVSVRDLGDALGAKPSSLYAHFKSKDELFGFLVLLANQEIHRSLLEAIASVDPDPASTLGAIVRTYVSWHATYPTLGTVGHSDLHALSDASLSEVTELRKQTIDLFLDAIERGNESGEFSCARPWLAVAALAGMGIRVSHWYRPPAQPINSVIDTYAITMQQWVPPVSTEDLAEEYVAYALAIVRATPRL